MNETLAVKYRPQTFFNEVCSQVLLRRYYKDNRTKTILKMFIFLVDQVNRKNNFSKNFLQ